MKATSAFIWHARTDTRPHICMYVCMCVCLLQLLSYAAVCCPEKHMYLHGRVYACERVWMCVCVSVKAFVKAAVFLFSKK